MARNEKKFGLYALFFYVLCLSLAQAGTFSWNGTEKVLAISGTATSGTCRFVFTNTTAGVIRLRDFGTSCSCISANAERKLYKPGESGFVDVFYKWNGRSGSDEQTVWVSSKRDDIDFLTVKIEISGAGRSKETSGK